MMSVLRFVMLVVLFTYSCALLAAILHAFDHWGIMSLSEIDFDRYLSFFKWPAIVLGAGLILLNTPIGDFLIGLCLPTRRQALREEAKITPALDELKERYKDKYGLSIKPKAYVMDLPNINGIAFGSRVVAVSSGLLKTAQDEEITAILAHEMGHLHHRDGFFNVALMVAAYPTFVLSMFLSYLYIVTWLIGAVLMLIFAPLVLALSLGGLLVIGLHFLLEKILMWPVEYKADRFAADMGFAPALISLFERIEDEDVRGEEGFLAKYAYTHPPTALRIDKLERYLMKEEKICT